MLHTYLILQALLFSLEHFCQRLTKYYAYGQLMTPRLSVNTMNSKALESRPLPRIFHVQRQYLSVKNTRRVIFTFFFRKKNCRTRRTMAWPGKLMFLSLESWPCIWAGYSIVHSSHCSRSTNLFILPAKWRTRKSAEQEQGPLLHAECRLLSRQTARIILLVLARAPNPNVKQQWLLLCTWVASALPVDSDSPAFWQFRKNDEKNTGHLNVGFFPQFFPGQSLKIYLTVPT